MTEIWLEGDHYKWRAMRADGVPERDITGDASDWEKFEAWAATVPHTLRNPLYHWTHLELAFPFGVKGKLLGPDTAREIYEHCNGKLAEDDFTTQGLLRQFDVRSSAAPTIPSTISSRTGATRSNAEARHQALPDLAARQGAGGARSRAAGTAGSTRWAPPRA